MRVFSRTTGLFLLLLLIGYLAVAVFVPQAPVAGAGDQLITGRSVADRLSNEAKALITSRKPSTATP